MSPKTLSICRQLLFATTLLVLAVSCSRDHQDKTLRFASTVAGQNGEFGEIFGIAVKDGDTYFSDGQKGRIWKVHAGETSLLTEGLDTPSGISFTATGDIVIADAGTNQVLISKGDDVWSGGIFGSPDKKRGFADGEADTALFNGPIGVAAGPDGKVYVADTYNDRIRVIENGRVSTLAGGTRGFADGVGNAAKFDTPTGLAVWQDKLLVADTGNRRIRVVEPNGVVWTLAGTGNGDLKDGIASQASFVEPTGLAVDQYGTIYVGDGNAVRTLGGLFPIVRTISASSRGASDGPLTRARFNAVSGMAVAADGSVIVADSENRLVRRLSHDRGPEITEAQVTALRGTVDEFRKAAPGRWPYDPPTAKREIAGTLGELRGDVDKDPNDLHFHNGLDVAGAYGETARFVRDEKVLRPLATDNFGTLRELIRMPTMGYIHIRLGRDKDDKPFGDDRFLFSADATGKLVDVRVPRGASFKAGEPIGTLNAMNHVHLIAGRTGSEMNALDALILPGVADSKPPTVEAAIFRQNGNELKPQNGKLKLSGAVTILMRAYDQVDGNASRRRLGLYQAGWQLLRMDRSPLTNVQWNIRFDRTPPNYAVSFVYGPGSKSGATGETIFNYIVTNRVEADDHSEGSFDTAAYPTGEYIVRVWAGDYFGNNSYADTLVEIVR